MKELDFTMQEFTDGTVEARMSMYQSARILANDELTLNRGIRHVIDAMDKKDKEVAKGRLQGQLDLPMQGQWLEGRFCVRFLRVPGFGIDFDDEQGIQEWLLAFEQGQRKVSA